MDGFVYAVTPFNFTALAVNLVMAPIIMGNVVIWKPSPGAIYSNYLFQQIMIEAGLPPGVLQFLPGDAELVTDVVLSSRELGGLHFTGSTAVFRSLSSKIGANMSFWRSYPRVVGETGTQRKCHLSRTRLILSRWQELSSPTPHGRCQERGSQECPSSVRVPGPEV